MFNFFTLLRRELLTLFVGATAYVVAVVFYLMLALYFIGNLSENPVAEPRTLFDPFGYLLTIFLAPILTMRLLSEEKRIGSLEMLMTTPVNDWEVVLAKFASSLLYYSFLVSVTVVHVYVMFRWNEGPLNWGSFFTSYLGVLLIASVFLSIGLFCSSLFENQALSAGLGIIIGIFIVTIGQITAGTRFQQFGPERDLLEFLLPYSHYKNFLKGLIDTRDFSYFIGLTVFFLFLTTKVVESRKWR